MVRAIFIILAFSFSALGQIECQGVQDDGQECFPKHISLTFEDEHIFTITTYYEMRCPRWPPAGYRLNGQAVATQIQERDYYLSHSQGREQITFSHDYSSALLNLFGSEVELDCQDTGREF